MDYQQVRNAITSRRKGPWEFLLVSGQIIRVAHIENLSLIPEENRVRLYAGKYVYDTAPQDIAAIRFPREETRGS